MSIVDEVKKYDEVLFLLQGGGALGAYQVGIAKALMEHACEPTWIIGTSIGGINGAIIAGNKPEHRVTKLKKFWDKIAVCTPDLIPDFLPQSVSDGLRTAQNIFVSDWSASVGVNGFFKPRMINPWLQTKATPDQLSYYDTDDLAATLEEVIDFNLLNSKKVRLTVSAVCIETGDVVRFDNTKQEITPQHIMATGALPPGLPAVKIDGQYYWDGGLNSNTPFEVLLEEKLLRNVLCFVVNLFSYIEHMPSNMAGIVKRRKDLEYVSQHHNLIHYFCEMQNYQRELQKMIALIPDAEKNPVVQQILEKQHPITLNIARFHYRDKPYDAWTKDYEFSEQSIKERMEQGFKDVKQALATPSWLELRPEQIQLHNF